MLTSVRYRKGPSRLAIGLEKSEQDKMISRQESKEMVNKKIEKILKCSKCSFETSITKKKVNQEKQSRNMKQLVKMTTKLLM